jgi:hypothetical protein
MELQGKVMRILGGFLHYVSLPLEAPNARYKWRVNKSKFTVEIIPEPTIQIVLSRTIQPVHLYAIVITRFSNGYAAFIRLRFFRSTLCWVIHKSY